LLREYSPTGSALHPEYPFFHLQSDGLWQVNPPITTASGRSPSAKQMRVADVVGSLPHGMVTALQRDPLLFGAIVRHLLNYNFEPSLHDDICAMAGLDLKALQIGPPLETNRDRAFRDDVLAAYEYQCAVCGFEGRIKSQAVGLEAAHVRWWASGGPDAVENSLCLCSLHHKLLDTGVLGLTQDHRVLVSKYFVARSEIGQRMVLDFVGRSLLEPQRGQPRVLADYIRWHGTQVFKSPARAA
jgi:putative restriction endonuclease